MARVCPDSSPELPCFLCRQLGLRPFPVSLLPQVSAHGALRRPLGGLGLHVAGPHVHRRPGPVLLRGPCVCPKAELLHVALQASLCAASGAVWTNPSSRDDCAKDHLALRRLFCLILLVSCSLQRTGQRCPRRKDR